jgi:uncharacterized protein
MNYLLLSSLSFVVGTLVGLTGVGGAALLTPMLIFVFQVPPSVAVSSDVMAATLMKVVGGIKHWKQETLDLRVVKWLAFGSVPGSLAGVGLLHVLRQSQDMNLDSILLHSIGVAILLIASIALIQLLLITFVPHLQLPSVPKFDLDTYQGRILTVSVGGILGCIVGLTSVSSGSMFALVLITFFQLDARKLVGTDIVQAAILLGFTSMGHLTLGTVQWDLVVSIWVGSIPGVLLGSRLCEIIPQRVLRFSIYSILVMISWKMAHPV